MINLKEFTVVCLCGSTKFKDAYLETAKIETLAGKLVLVSSIFSHADGDALTLQEIELLNLLHRQKIRLCDEILVINKDGYIGESTREEIVYAQELGRRVRYLR